MKISLSKVSRKISRILMLALVASACRPLLTTDSLPAKPPSPDQAEPPRLAPPYRQGKIKISPPRGWQISRLPRLKYPIFKQDEVTSISVLETQSPQSLDQFIQTNLQSMAIAFPDWQQLAEQTFQTATALEGKLVVSTSQQFNQPLYQHYYFFGNQDQAETKIVLICSGRKAAAQQLQQICDASAKTFEIQR